MLAFAIFENREQDPNSLKKKKIRTESVSLQKFAYRSKLQR